MKLTATQAKWALLLATVCAAACQGRSEQPVVVGSTTSGAPGSTGTHTGVTTSPFNTGALTPVGGTQIPGGTTPAAASVTTLSTSQQKTGQTYVNGWDGLTDCDNSKKGTAGCATPAAYTVSTTASQPPAGAANATAATGSSAATTTPPPASTASTTPPASSATTADPSARALTLVQQNCGSSCHAAGGQQPDLSTASAIQQSRSQISGSLSSMLPKISPAMSSSDQQTISSWASGQGGSAGASSAPPAAALTDAANVSGPTNENGTRVWTMTITDNQPKNGIMNSVPIQAKVGDTLRIVNKRSSNTFTIHTNGTPFPHGSPIDPGQSQDYQLGQPYSDGVSGFYEHTDGSDNSQTMGIQMSVQ